MTQIAPRTGPPTRGFTDVLDRCIQQLGYSVRKSRIRRKAVFRIMAAALGRGEEVQTPFGTLRTVGAPDQRERWNPMRQTNEIAYRRQRRIVFEPAA